MQMIQPPSLPILKPPIFVLKEMVTQWLLLFLNIHNFSLQVLIGEKITWLDLTQSLFWILYLNASIMLGVPGHVLVHPGVAHPSRAGHLSRLGIHILNTILWMNESVLVHPWLPHPSRVGHLSIVVIHVLNISIQNGK